MLQAPSLIPLPVPLTVVLHYFWIRLAPPFLIPRMFVPPLFLAFVHNLAILGVDRQFLAVVIGAASALARRLAADHLFRTINRRQKTTVAVGTATRLAQAHPSVIQEMNLCGKVNLVKQATPI